MKRYTLKIVGVVQGVGFRPFVYSLAKKYSLTGQVLNSSSGVFLEIQGEEPQLKRFIKDLKNRPPVLARIDSLDITEISIKDENSFIILESKDGKKSGLIPPDIAICKECEEEIRDPKSRFFNYPFTNCTNCGPRYTIIQTVPYDRKQTTMDKFVMCQDCQREYQDPNNRRYHAEPISCPQCGVSLTLFNSQQEEIGGDPLNSCVELLKQGRIGAIKGIGGFHLVCDATNEEAIKTLRERKKRAKKPFAVMFPSLKEIKKHAEISVCEEFLIDSFEKPIVIVKKRGNKLSSLIAPEIDRLGVFLPYTPLHTLLLDKLEKPIIATSANLSGDSILHRSEDVFEKLFPVVDFVLDNNREILNPCDDSIVQEVNKKRVILRSARGFAPASFPIKFDTPTLGVGAHQKSTIALGFEKTAIVSPFIGDLESVENSNYFSKTVESFTKFYEFSAKKAVRDSHEDYFSSKYANQFEVQKLQHHYAHVLSVMAEKSLDQQVLGIVFDGTGLGDDGTIWGGEFLECDRKSYKRVGHFKAFKLLGGVASIKDIRRLAISKLLDLYSLDEVCALDLEVVKSFSDKELKTLGLIHSKGINSPFTSSVGRVFDMVATLSGICLEQSFEGESGLKIEKYYLKKFTESFSYEIKDGVVDFDMMIKEIIGCKSKEEVASKFLNTLVEISTKFAKESNLPVVIAGGVFQNRTLLELLICRLERENITYYFQNKTAINDGSLSLGQLYFKSS